MLIGEPDKVKVEEIELITVVPRFAVKDPDNVVTTEEETFKEPVPLKIIEFDIVFDCKIVNFELI
jgi:hypothetical protein